MAGIFWTEFGALFAAALIGGVAVMPYALKLVKESSQRRPLKMAPSKLIVLSVLQIALLSAVAVAVGLLAGRPLGLGAPYLEATLMGISVSGAGKMLTLASVTGALAGLTLLVADVWFLPYWPQALVEASHRTTVGDTLLASIYGGINEEIFMRLFGLSVVAWFLSLVWHTPAGLPPAAVLWSANIIMTIVFGLGHLPALKGLVGVLSPLMVMRSLLLNAPVGLLCGWLYWTYGIEAAMLAHFSTDIVYHVFGTIVLNRRRRLS
jgi:hypothetical protein